MSTKNNHYAHLCSFIQTVHVLDVAPRKKTQHQILAFSPNQPTRVWVEEIERGRKESCVLDDVEGGFNIKQG